MDIKELRVGNWVKDKFSGEKLKISSINMTEGGDYQLFFQNINESSGLISCVEGIWLDEQIFSNFGFEQKTSNLYGLPNETFFYKGNLVIIKENNMYKLVLGKYNAQYGCEFIPIHFVHNLQNLHIEMLKEECEINL